MNPAASKFRATTTRPVWGWLFTACFALGAAEVDVTKLAPPATEPIDYDRDIKPIFEASCFRCHGPERPKSGFSLENRTSALKGGKNGVDIVPGDSAKSPLIHYVSRLVEDMEMPPAEKGTPLTPREIGLLRAWIDQGATYPDSASGSARMLFQLTPMVRWVSVSGNERKFREDWSMPDGASGGIERFEWREPVGHGVVLSAQGHALIDAHDYQIKVSLEKTDVGFVRGGFEEFRRWQNDVGGYYPAFGTTAPDLGRDLHMVIGKAWFEAGLTEPGLPRITVGYEYQFRHGVKSTLEWGLVSDPISGNSIGIYPATKDVDEGTHVVKFDVSHDLGVVLVEDSFRGEFYDSHTRRLNTDNYTLGQPTPDSVSRYREDYDHFQAANAFRLEKSVFDWLFLSGGYLYSHLDGNASFSADILFPSDPTLLPFQGDYSNQILLEQESHIFNANTQLGPWQDLTFTAGVQSGWTRQLGFGNAVVGGFTTPFDANLDKFATEERFSLKYTRIPYTVLFAEAGFQQESDGQFERNTVQDGFDDQSDFLRNTDARADLKRFETGFTVSPWQRVSFSASFKHSAHRTDYNQLADTDGSTLPGNGYPAFILARNIKTDEINTKLVLHPTRWLKTTLKYQLVSTDFDTTTQDGIDAGTGIPFLGGRIRAGNYDAHVYSLSQTLTPWQRLRWTGTLSYSDSRTVSAANNGTTIAPYRGGIYSLLSSLTFALNEATDLVSTYSFSRADFAQADVGGALPLGITYDRHGLLTGLTRRFKKNLTASLQYGFFRYREPTAGGANDYTAHAVFASVTKLFP